MSNPYQRALRLGKYLIIVLEGHPESVIDLRLDQPWAELKAHAAKTNLKGLTSHELSHLPYPILILAAVEIWKANHNALPLNRPEKAAFSEILKNIGAGLVDDENIREALAHCYRLFAGTSIPTDLSNYMQDAKAKNLTEQVNVWALSLVVRGFLVSSQRPQ